jgi:Protein of unknown function (DUF4232)
MNAMRHRRVTRLAAVLVTAAGIGAAGAAVAHASAGAAAATPRCRLSQLSLAKPRMNGAAGTIRLRFVFTNIGGSTCQLFGFPGMQMLNKTHHAIPTHVHRGTGNNVPPEPEIAVVMPHGTGACPSSSFVEVTPPNDFKHFTQKLSIMACGGKITVSPVVHGRLPV